MKNKQKFKNFLESLKGNGQDTLIENVKKGFNACFENSQFNPDYKRLFRPDLNYAKSGMYNPNHAVIDKCADFIKTGDFKSLPDYDVHDIDDANYTEERRKFSNRLTLSDAINRLKREESNADRFHSLVNTMCKYLENNLQEIERK